MEMFASLVVILTGKEQLKCVLIGCEGPLQIQDGTATMLLLLVDNLDILQMVCKTWCSHITVLTVAIILYIP